MNSMPNLIPFLNLVSASQSNSYEATIPGIFLYLVIGFITGFALASVLCKRKIRDAYKKLKHSACEEKTIEASMSKTKSKLEEKIWYEEELSFIFRLIEEISLSLSKEEIAEYIVQEVWKFLDIEQCVFILLDENIMKLKVKSAIDIKEGAVKYSFLKEGESISGWVMKNNEPLVINDLDNDPWFKQINKEDYLKGAFISVPLSIKNRALGVINVCNKKTGEVFTKKDLEFLTNVAKVGAIALQNVRLHEQMQESYLKTITALAAAIDAKDPYTKAHSENVTRYSVAIAKQMNCTLAEIETIKRAGLLHDIGKIGTRDEVLLKANKLTPEEFEQIKFHPLKGESIVESLSFLKEVSILIRHHHERYDGSGYPDGMNGRRIELGARILAVTDAFDAMTSDRPYRKRFSLENAVDELRKKRGVHFDPEVVDCFLKILEQNSHIVGDS